MTEEPIQIEDDISKQSSKSGIGIIEIEDGQVGKVAWNVYTKLISSVGRFVVTLVFFFVATAAQFNFISK